MNIFDKEEVNISSTKTGTGGYKAMLKSREENLDDFKETINAIFENYTGVPVAIVMVNEDENGNPIGVREVVLGAGNFKSQLRLGKGAMDVANRIKDEVVDAAAKNPKSVPELIRQVADLMEDLDGEDEDK